MTAQHIQRLRDEVGELVELERSRGYMALAEEMQAALDEHDDRLVNLGDLESRGAVVALRHFLGHNGGPSWLRRQIDERANTIKAWEARMLDGAFDEPETHDAKH